MIVVSGATLVVYLLVCVVIKDVAEGNQLLWAHRMMDKQETLLTAQPAMSRAALGS